MSELSPCPFCGGEALMRERYVQGIANTKHYRRECRHCKATFANWYRSMKKADEAWNHRVNGNGIDVLINEPLTLSELYNVDNEPLYFYCMVGQWSLNGWHIVKPINYDEVGFKDLQLDNNENHIEDTYNYGITWVFYIAKNLLKDLNLVNNLQNKII